jgi:hypothetical protein
MSSRIARPIKMLEAAVSDVARAKLDTVIENIRSLDELGRLLKDLHPAVGPRRGAGGNGSPGVGGL